MARIAAGNEDSVNAGQLFEHGPPFVKREFDGFRIGIIFVHGGIPDPHVERVFIRQARHFDHHFHRRPWEMRTVLVII